MHSTLSSVELCAGGGGQALGIERAGFGNEALVEIDDWSRATLKLNRPGWNVVEGTQADLTRFDGLPYRGVDLVAGPGGAALQPGCPDGELLMRAR